jgi:hypothetical protein
LQCSKFILLLLYIFIFGKLILFLFILLIVNLLFCFKTILSTLFIYSLFSNIFSNEFALFVLLLNPFGILLISSFSLHFSWLSFVLKVCDIWLFWVNSSSITSVVEIYFLSNFWLWHIFWYLSTLNFNSFNSSSSIFIFSFNSLSYFFNLIISFFKKFSTSWTPLLFDIKNSLFSSWKNSIVLKKYILSFVLLER